ncbi:UDP-N-acetylmuramoylalanine--D-glutamate ligase [Vibrio sp. UCD-FRSSP16_10]|uniref:UDP-N-acetylmuramoyl-L-alanine--D-glutamate ligase n=1 Tax=unclassified Vibrio TaxID=2614977 RepID=UPI0007FD1596|nr:MULTISPECIES: UDP-N-acetylmuramoyl-L-alanine--D-glutamate ligase [unclassified Vibrio]OBT07342.1 UDP-N-acetylmuramoylalanine--D-glutamate ligase [Vibrio sp. UCD-FRSSP16_30]OBT12821.1 UDP-N-acetylmuramoylalanine--D-glutamate ligase [Vibrio sp. UCD-FRSSP16_10]
MQQWQKIQEVVVIGLGITGLSVVKHLQKVSLQLGRDLTIKVIDTRENPTGAEHLSDDIPLFSGGLNQQWLEHADLIVASPGIALATPELQKVIAQGIPVVGDIELFAWAVTKPVLAITGSNGKSTVTDLTGVMANAAGVKTAVGGNIGVPALELLNTDADLFVLELSSFQLETTSSLSLQAAAFLNLSEDHMDRYEGMHDYRDAKLRIFDNANIKIVNADDKATYPSESLGLVEFGVEQGKYCLSEHQGQLWLTCDNHPILATNELSIVGQHNMLNALVAIALLDAAEVNIAAALDALKSYVGLAHRCQVVSRNDGIVWVNDSKATNVASTLAALKGLHVSGRLYLLVGGAGKGADFSELKPALCSLNVELYCFGADGKQLLSLSENSVYFDSMQEAVTVIRQKAKLGDMVMLSPACASLDQFANFMQRGDIFTQLAQHNGELQDAN